MKKSRFTETQIMAMLVILFGVKVDFLLAALIFEGELVEPVALMRIRAED